MQVIHSSSPLRLYLFHTIMPALAQRLPVRSATTHAPTGRRTSAVAVRAVKVRYIEEKD